jgi:hypothetical protein
MIRSPIHDPGMPKSARLELLLRKYEGFKARRGPVRAFALDAAAGTFHPASREAYFQRILHCKILVALDQNSPCLDPIAETRSQSGGVRRVLWLYLFNCLPLAPEHSSVLTSLHRLNNSTKFIQGCEAFILAKLAAGSITDDAFAQRALDDSRFFSFAHPWLKRKANKGAGGPT